jgi:hypothetical protein
MIINKKDRNLKKGSGYHLDLFIIGFLSIVCGFLGVPIMCSATVRSVTHVSALSVYSTTHAPGEKPKLLSIREQRATSLAVHAMIGMLSMAIGGYVINLMLQQSTVIDVAAAIIFWKLHGLEFSKCSVFLFYSCFSVPQVCQLSFSHVLFKEKILLLYICI